MKKAEYIGFRVPTADRERFEAAARAERRDLSDFVWDAACSKVERMRQERPELNRSLQASGL